MTLHAYDGADPTFNLAAAKAHGGIICSVYIVGTPGGMAHADAARVKAIRAAGMGVLPNWERQADFFDWCTVAQAEQAGVEAAAACRAEGIPATGKIGVAFSFDFEVPVARFGEMTNKLKACQAGLGTAYKAVGYGQSELIEYWAAHGITGPHWLMMSTFGRPYYSNSPHVFMWQQVGGSPVASTDVSIVTHPETAPVWWPDGSPYATPTPVPQPKPDVPGGPVPINDLPTTGEWATKFSNNENNPPVKRTAAGWLIRVVQQLNTVIGDVAAIRADTAAIRKKLGA